MRIKSIKSFIVNSNSPKNCCFVKVETDEGISGWGECYTQSDRDIQISSHVDQLSRYLIGRDPAQIKNFTQIGYDDFASKRGSMDLYSAISGIEQALWDIKGKTLNTPVFQLLGGKVRDEVRVYANGWSQGSKDPLELAERASSVVEMGFDALKFDPVPGPWRNFVGKDVVNTAIANVSAVREQVGPDVDILIEIHRRLAPMHATTIAKQIEQYNPFWYEEPIQPENLDALAEVRRKINIPVVTGEALYTKTAFRDVFAKRAADIINPDVCNVGGILELNEIAATAASHLVGVAPHNYNSTGIGLASTIQCCATMPNFVITEYFLNMEQVTSAVTEDPLVIKNGKIKLTDKPGLGVNLNEKALVAHVSEIMPQRSLPENYNS